MRQRNAISRRVTHGPENVFWVLVQFFKHTWRAARGIQRKGLEFFSHWCDGRTSARRHKACKHINTQLLHFVSVFCYLLGAAARLIIDNGLNLRSGYAFCIVGRWHLSLVDRLNNQFSAISSRNTEGRRTASSQKCWYSNHHLIFSNGIAYCHAKGCQNRGNANCRKS